MILYHGSNQEICNIDLSKSRPNKDFGQGFYLTADKEQALRMGEQKARQNGGSPILNIYEFDESVLGRADFNIKIFDSYSEEWARFILANRDRRTQVRAHDFDIVVGPIADDQVGLQFFRYMKRYINLPTLIENLKYVRVTIQYYFGTERAIKLLKKV